VSAAVTARLCKKRFFQWAADRLQTTACMGLKAADESNTAGFKQFRSSETVPNQVPYADIDYDSVPVVSDIQTNPGTAGCVTGPNRPYLRSCTAWDTWFAVSAAARR